MPVSRRRPELFGCPRWVAVVSVVDAIEATFGTDTLGMLGRVRFMRDATTLVQVEDTFTGLASAAMAEASRRAELEPEEPMTFAWEHLACALAERWVACHRRDP